MYSNHGSCATSSPHNGSSGPNATLPGAPPGSFSFVSGDVGSPLSSGGAGDAAESQLYRSPTPSSSPSAPEATTEIGIHGSASPRTAPQGDAAFVSGAAAAEAEGVRATMPLHSRESGAASSSSIYSASTSSSSHPLLYSVSRFTEPVKRIILIRNGRSEANEDVAAYVHTPDWRIPLVEEGKHESIAAGRALGELTGDDPVYFYYSPYIRSRQSLRYVLQGYDEARLSGRHHTREWWEEEEDVDGVEEGGSAARGDVGVAPYPESEAAVYGGLPLGATGIATTFAEEPSCRGGEVAGNNLTDLTTDINSASFLQKDSSLVLNSGTSDNIIGVREDVRLRDGDIGRYTTVEELMHHLLERERYGKFFYRFPFGESGADVCDRVTSFLDAFQRERVEFPMNTNVVIITHGLTMRMFIKRWFHLTVETFHRMKSPPPGSLCTLTRLHHRSCFRLDESCVELMHLPLSLNEYNGYKYRNKQLLGSMSSGAPYM
jgi:broad specificity phosphatase PhoE